MDEPRDDDSDRSEGDELNERERARLERAAAFHAAHGDEPLTPPLIVAGLLALAWWALLGWQAWMWWPRTDADLAVAVGVASVERDGLGAIQALRVGAGADAIRFECARRGRWQWRVLYVPLIECRDAAVLAAAEGRQVHVRYDRPAAGGGDFRRLLALTGNGRPLWSLADSADAFMWLLWRAAFVAGLLLFPGWWQHRVWRSRPD